MISGLLPYYPIGLILYIVWKLRVRSVYRKDSKNNREKFGKVREETGTNSLNPD